MTDEVAAGHGDAGVSSPVLEDFPHSTRSVIITSKNISSLVRMSTARLIKHEQVKRVMKLFEAGEHFSSPMVVYWTREADAGKSSYELIDGNNRTEAIRRWLETHPDFRIRIDMIAYHDLTEHQKIVLFTRYNEGRKVDKTDMLLVHRDDLPAVRDLLKIYPIPIDIGAGVKDENSPNVKLNALILAHLTSVRNLKLAFYAPRLWEEAMSLDRRDYYIMRQFGDAYSVFAKDAFREKGVMKVPVFSVLYRMWYLNCIDIPFAGGDSQRLFIDRMRDALHLADVLTTLRRYNNSGGKAAEAGTLEHFLLKTVNANRAEKMLAPSDTYGVKTVSYAHTSGKGE